MAVTRVLIIDDEKENVRYLTTILEENGFKDIHAAYDGAEGMERVRALKPGLILLDLRMPKKSGIAVFTELKQDPQTKEIPVIILTGEGGFLKHLAELRAFHENGESLEALPTEEVLSRFIRSRPDAFLEKPIEPEVLMSVIGRILLTLEEARDIRCREVEKLLEKMLGRKVTFRGHPLKTDPPSRAFLCEMATALLSKRGLPGEILLQRADGACISFSGEDLLTFQGVLTGWTYANHKAAWDHKEAIRKLGSIPEVEAYPIHGGWPDSSLS